ncbi:DUF1289 domain-containing protein [Vibrio eleionomae]
MFKKSKAAEPLPNPCVKNCAMDGSKICVGCHRTIDEILQWHDASPAEQQEILLRAQARKKQPS